MTAEAPAKPTRATLPEHGHSRAEVTAMIDEASREDILDFEQRLMAGGTYPAGDDVMEVAKEAYLRFFSTNPLYTLHLPEPRADGARDRRDDRGPPCTARTPPAPSPRAARSRS